MLETADDERLGAKCLVALAFLKTGASSDHPKVQEALEACRTTSASAIANKNNGVYSNGLAIIFLVELNPAGNRDLIARFAGVMEQRQKDHGGFGYKTQVTGDTSQTQYAALSYWELLRAGMPPKVESVDRCLTWLLRTQDPNGCWGYQGKLGELGSPVEQRRTSVSMLAAGMGGLLICGNILGSVGSSQAGVEETQQSDLPASLRRADEDDRKARKMTIAGTKVDPALVRESIARGQAWMDKNFSIKWTGYPTYYLYSLERYKSFEEVLNGEVIEGPEWYNQGVAELQKLQNESGGWNDQSNEASATAFAVLFLVRSTQKSIKASLGEGTLVGGRGLSANLANMKMQRGRLVAVVPQNTEVDQLLNMLEDSEGDNLEALLESPAALAVEDVKPEESRRLQQIVRSGNPEARVLAVRALARTRKIDFVPTLLYAMTDPDRRVVREARDGLRFISRRFEGYGLSDNYTDSERYEALDRWKQWYATLRPDAPPPF
ncbi:MAG: hypothetical protein AAGA92_07095 [Planctomycetota bacterium]